MKRCKTEDVQIVLPGNFTAPRVRGRSVGRYLLLSTGLLPAVPHHSNFQPGRVVVTDDLRQIILLHGQRKLSMVL